MRPILPAFLAAFFFAATAARADMPIDPGISPSEIDAQLKIAAQNADWASTPPMRLALPGVPESWRVSELVIAGTGAPTAETFAALRAEGVHTIVCLDAIPPDLNAAKAHGMLSMHVPTRRGRIDVAEHIRLLRVLGYLRDDFYIYADPGDRRVLARAAMAVQWMDMRWAGYRALGLMSAMDVERDRAADWASAFGPARKVNMAVVKEKSPLALDPAVAPPPLSVEMRRIDAAFERLSDFAGNGWKSLPHLSDATPADEARAIAESLARRADLHLPGEDGLSLGLRRTAADAGALADELAKGNAGAAGAKWEALRAACMECHRATRDR